MRQGKIKGARRVDFKSIAATGPIVSIIWKPIMRTIKTLAIAFSLTLAGVTMAHAEDKCPTTPEHNVPHEISGKKYVCDKCVISSCDTGGKTISNCKKTTNWTNCVEPPADKKK